MTAPARTDPAAGTAPCFLDVPTRAAKPRRVGITHAIDLAMPTALLDSYLDSCAEFVDVIKVGWGLSYMDPRHARRVEVCRARGVQLSTGGTLLEIAAQQGRVDEFAEWAQETGVDVVEVSNGLGLLSRGAKSDLIGTLAGTFEVLAETGSKDESFAVNATSWAKEMRDDLDAGARHVIAEARESGTVGLYESSGAPRVQLIETIVNEVDVGQVIFEAPKKSQQAWLIRQFGSDVNLGNVAVADILALESLRLRLRADTVIPSGIPRE